MTPRISAAAMMFGTAASNLPSMSVAGLDIASSLSTSSAAISAGTNTKISTRVPTICEIRSRGVEAPGAARRRSAPAAARMFVVSPASTLPSSQPTKPMTNAANTLGSIASALATMTRTGSSRPPRL